MEKRVRRGGLRIPEGFLFELTGGNLALDFTNTVDSRPTGHPDDLLPAYSDVCSWARQAKVITRLEELNLLKKAGRNPNEAESVLKTAIALRECLFLIFRHLIDGENISEDLLRKWNKFIQRANDHYELVAAKQGFSWKSNADPLDYDAMLWPIIHSAVELLTSANIEKLRRCAADNCDWLFLDNTKRGNRRWCDMTVCGN